MKNRLTITAVIAAIFGIIAGFLIGISVEYPRISNEDLSGTIGKVKKYNNAKATEADIKLQNELASDTTLLISMRNYIAFYYVNALSLGEQIEIAVNESRSVTDFSNRFGTEINTVENFGQFLSETRSDLLLMLALCDDPKSVNAALIKNFTAQTQNIIVRTNYYRNSILNLIGALESFILENPKGSTTGLENAHDILTYNQAVTATLTNDKLMLKYLDKKRFFASNYESRESDKIKSKIEEDRLQLKAFFDSEKLGAGFFDSEKLGITFFDSEKLGFLDFESLGKIIAFDSEKLNSFRSDNNQLAIFDFEKLGRIIAFDAEKLGLWSNISSAELGKGPGLWDNEKLGAIFRAAEKLGAGFTDAEKLGAGFTDSEQLGVIK